MAKGKKSKEAPQKRKRRGAAAKPPPKRRVTRRGVKGPSRKAQRSVSAQLGWETRRKRERRRRKEEALKREEGSKRGRARKGQRSSFRKEPFFPYDHEKRGAEPSRPFVATVRQELLGKWGTWTPAKVAKVVREVFDELDRENPDIHPEGFSGGFEWFISTDEDEDGQPIWDEEQVMFWQSDLQSKEGAVHFTIAKGEQFITEDEGEGLHSETTQHAYRFWIRAVFAVGYGSPFGSAERKKRRAKRRSRRRGLRH